MSDTTIKHYDAIFTVNVKGVLFTVQKALALMPDGGSIILNASIFGSKGPEGWSVYEGPHLLRTARDEGGAVRLRPRHIQQPVQPGRGGEACADRIHAEAA